MEQSIEDVGLLGLLGGFHSGLELIPFIVGEADYGLMVP